jgi:hypothetical protein
MVPPHARRSRKRRQEELRRSRRIIPCRTATSPRTHRAAGARSGARSYSSTSARTCAGRSGIPATRTRRGRARVWLSSTRIGLWRRCRWRGDNWFWGLDRLWWYHCGSCVRDWLDSHILQPLASRIATTTPTTSTRRTRPTGTKCVLALEILRRKGVENQEDDDRMHKKRGGDTLPPPLPLAPARYADWRPIFLIRVTNESHTIQRASRGSEL